MASILLSIFGALVGCCIAKRVDRRYSTDGAPEPPPNLILLLVLSGYCSFMLGTAGAVLDVYLLINYAHVDNPGTPPPYVPA
jgi:hypothetical protein